MTYLYGLHIFPIFYFLNVPMLICFFSRIHQSSRTYLHCNTLWTKSEYLIKTDMCHYVMHQKKLFKFFFPRQFRISDKLGRLNVISSFKEWIIWKAWTKEYEVYQIKMVNFQTFSPFFLIWKKDSNADISIKHNAVRSKQHSFIAQLSARVQEVYYFASLLSLCTGVSYKLTEQLMWKTMNTYTVIINTKTDRKSKEIKHGAVKKEVFFLFCTEFNQKSLTHTHTHTHTHTYTKSCKFKSVGREFAKHYKACGF